MRRGRQADPAGTAEKLQREHVTADEDPVFAGQTGGHLDASACAADAPESLSAPAWPPLPFRSLRHHFGSMAVNADPSH